VKLYILFEQLAELVPRLLPVLLQLLLLVEVRELPALLLKQVQRDVLPDAAEVLPGELGDVEGAVG